MRLDGEKGGGQALTLAPPWVQLFQTIQPSLTQKSRKPLREGVKIEA